MVHFVLTASRILKEFVTVKSSCKLQSNAKAHSSECASWITLDPNNLLIIYRRNKMTNLELVKSYQEQVDASKIRVNFVEDFDVPQGDLYIDGAFNPHFESDEDVPIEINFYVNSHADIDDSDIVWMDNIDHEFVMTVNHEMTHLLQLQEGRFIFDWTGAYEDNPNEIEAYANEGNGRLF